MGPIYYDLYDLWPVAILRRVPRGWTGEKRIHEMLLTSGGLVWHNTPERGEHFETLEEAIAGIETALYPIPPELQPAAYGRLIQAMQNPRAYDTVVNNCQDTVSRIVYGVSRSETRNTLLAFSGLAALVYVATRA